jgi:hypothetical protein
LLLQVSRLSSMMNLINVAIYLYTVITPTIIGAAAVIFTAAFIVSRLYLHPLSKFRGPKIAALTRWYEFYHDVIRGGTYVKYYPELHKKYGILNTFLSKKLGS